MISTWTSPAPSASARSETASATLQQEQLKGFSLDVQTLDVGVLHVPDAGVIIVSGFNDCDAHQANCCDGWRSIARRARLAHFQPYGISCEDLPWN